VEKLSWIVKHSIFLNLNIDVVFPRGQFTLLDQILDQGTRPSQVGNMYVGGRTVKLKYKITIGEMEGSLGVLLCRNYK
jgi:hypothetical protein